ncbi:hypothetical protein KY285_026614 [Solanum tuberosum]|nr:hypothetical protein KY285_026614 [Solanum tuberosum]
MATKYLNLRFKFGCILVSEVGPVYAGGRTEYVENVDEDHLLIPELVDYAKSFGIKEDIDSDSICFDQSIDYGSDVDEELSIVKEDVRKFKESRRRKKKEKPKGFLGEVGLDEGYENIEKGKKNIKGKLIEDEPYYDSSDCDSFQSDEEEPISNDELEGGSLRGRKKSNRVIYDSSCDVVIWQCGFVFESVKEFREAVTKYAIKKGVELDKYVNESTRGRVKCKSGCPFLLYASKEGRSETFTI